MTTILPTVHTFLPPSFNIGGESLLRSRHHSGNGTMKQLETLCPGCGMPLYEYAFNSSHYRIFCDNFKCSLFKQTQDSREKETEEETPKPRESFVRYLRSSYSAYNEERRQNYHLLRSLGVSSYEAPNMASRKQTRIYLEQIGYHKKKVSKKKGGEGKGREHK